MGKKDDRPRPFYGRHGELERMLEDLRWEIATEEAIRNQKKRPCDVANPPAYQKEDEKYKAV